MGKVYGIQGYVTGKVGNTVFAVRHGEQIGRQYNPVVANPKSTGQTTARAKFKLLSQLGEVLASYIAIPRMGNVSARNRFMKANYDATTFLDGTASIDVNVIQLTEGLTSLGGISVGRADSVLNARLVATFPDDYFSRVVYIAFVKKNNTLIYHGEAIATTGGAQQHWPVTTIPSTNEELVVFAYGMKDISELARQTFGSLQVINAETVAKLVVTSVFGAADVKFTSTSGITLGAIAGAKDLGDGE